MLYSKLIHFYNLLHKCLEQTSLNLNNSINSIQNISRQISEINDNLVELPSRLPFANMWSDTFISGVNASGRKSLEMSKQLSSIGIDALNTTMEL